MTSIMKKHAFLGLIVSLALFTPLSAHAQQVATIEEVQGEVLLHTAGAAADAWTPITKNISLNNGDSVKTQKGSCALVYGDQGTFRLDPNTTITVQDKTDTKDILLDLGKLKAKVNKEKVIKPFQVVTPTAVGAVRGTDVSFDFNDKGQLTIQLENGNVQVYNDELELNTVLIDKKTIIVQYDQETGILRIQNDCSSDGKVVFSVQGTEYAENPCDPAQEIKLETAGTGNPPTDVIPPGNPEPPDTHGDDPPDFSTNTTGTDTGQTE